MNSSGTPDSDQEFLIYTEITENPPEPTNEEIVEYAKRIGIDVEKEPFLLFLAREGINHKLPEPWKPCLNKTRDVVFYLNEDTQESQWEHPMDPIYRDRVIQSRAEFALNKIQSFDPLTKRPPNKDLPPIKRSGGSLVPINPISNSLGKLGGFGSSSSAPASGNLRTRAPQRPNSAEKNDFPNNVALQNINNNNNSLGRMGENSSNIISGSRLNTFKDTDDDEEDSSPSFVRPAPPKKLGGLTLTGGGANFLKGSKPEAPPSTAIGSKLGSLSSAKRDHEASNEEELGAVDMDKKPIKSILVNSISRSRPKIPSDNIYELDGFSMNLDEMTDEEKMVLSQLESSTTSKSKGNVKFNLDENTELKFEMEEEDDAANDEGNTDKTDDDDESSPASQNERRLPEHSVKPLPRHNGSGDSLHVPMENIVFRPSSFESDRVKIDYPYIPEYSDADIAAMKKAMRDEMEDELQKFKENLEDERKTRMEQIQKHLEETIAQFKLEKEETLKRIKKDMDTEKLQEIDRAKREIENLLQQEVEDMKIKFDESLHQKRLELEEEHAKQLKLIVTEFKKKEENAKQNLERQTSEESLKQIQDFKMQKENLRKEHKKQLEHMKDYHKTILEKVKLNMVVEDDPVPDYSNEDKAAMKKAMREEMDEELRKFKSQLEEERKARKELIQKDLEVAISQFKVEKEETLKRIRKDIDTEKVQEINKAKREIENILQEFEDMKTKFEENLLQRRKELEDEHVKKIEQLTTEYRKKEEKVKDVLAHQTSEEDSFKPVQDTKRSKDNLRKEHKKQLEQMKDYHKTIVEKVKADLVVEDISAGKSDSASEDAHQRIVEDAKAFIRMQKNRLKDPSPIPNSTHLILPTTKNNLLLFDEKLLKSVSPRRPTSIHLDLVSETESSGVSSLKDLRSSERKKLSKDIDDIYNSLNSLDQQMKLVWSVVKEKQHLQQQPYLVQDDSSSFLNATTTQRSSDISALLPNTVPLILGKSSTRVSSSLPASARKPLAPPPTPTILSKNVDGANYSSSDLTAALSAGPRYSSLLSNNQTSSSQTVLDALRMSGLSTTRLDCSDLLKSLEDELKEFKTTKQKMLEKGPGGGGSLDKKLSMTKRNNATSNILEKTKDLQEWLKKY